MEDLNRVVNNADLVADSRNILGNLRKSHFSRFAASVCFQNDVVLVPVGSECRRLDHELKSEDTEERITLGNQEIPQVIAQFAGTPRISI